MCGYGRCKNIKGTQLWNRGKFNNEFTIFFEEGGQKKTKMCGGGRALSATTPTTLYRFKGKHPKI